MTLAEGRPLPFADRQFDVVFCNSAIEHVTLPKAACGQRRFRDAGWVAASMRSQRAFAAEVRRVGKGYFVQTPHRAFPVEAHTWLPFVGWLLPATRQCAWCASPTGSGSPAAARKSTGTCSASARWCELLPDATIHVERVPRPAKSIVAYRDGRAKAPGAT
ncbi:MAG: methyltransferase domain-containing protein [Candidatus Binatia bacterium]